MTAAEVTLQTDRLTLRMLRESDLDAYAEMCADPEVMRYIGDGQPLARPMAWRNLAMMVGHWSLRGYGLWAVEERSSGVLGRAHRLLEPRGLARVRARLDAAPVLLGPGVCHRRGAGGPAVCLHPAGAAAGDQPDPPGERRLDSGCPTAGRAPGRFHRSDGKARAGVPDHPRGVGGAERAMSPPPRFPSAGPRRRTRPRSWTACGRPSSPTGGSTPPRPSRTRCSRRPRSAGALPRWPCLSRDSRRRGRRDGRVQPRRGGRRAHPGSATLPLARAIARIYELKVPTSPSSNLNIGMLGGSEVVNAKASDAWFTVDLRSTSNDVIADLEKKIATILDEEAKRAGLTVKTDVISSSPVAVLPGNRESNLVKIAEAVHRAMGFDPPIGNAGSNNSSAALLQGITSISTGAGPCSDSHALTENCEIEPLYKGIKKILLLEIALAGLSQ